MTSLLARSRVRVARRLGTRFGRAMAMTIAFALGALGSAPVFAQAWPAKPVKIIVPYPVGSSNEVFARVMGQKLSDLWKTGVLVEALPGAGGVVGTQAVAKAPADGYTLGWVSSPHAINAAIYPTLPFDPIRDFRPIVNFASTALVIVARPAFAANSIAELVAAAKASPGKLNYASNGNGSSSQLATELLASMAGVTFTHVPYKNTGQLTTDLMGGQVDFASLGVSAALPHIQGGRLKPLGVTAARRTAAMPNVPPVADTLPGYEAKSWMGLVAPAGSPDAVVARVQADAIAAIKDPGIAGAMSAQALDVEIMEAPQFARRIENDIRMWKKIVADVGIKVE
jgi:tripartite-type tricarboxylate transporter receptor subunit TctC